MNFLVEGCSYTKGAGLLLEENDPELWVNRLILSKYPGARITNAAQTGSSNEEIFKRTASKLLTNNYDFVIVGWSYISRITYTFGLELYKTTVMLNNPVNINLNQGVLLKKEYLQNIGNNLIKHRNVHYDLLDLIIYSNILTRLANNKICFVNSMSDIEENFFTKKEFKSPMELSKLEQSILSIDSRDDPEIQKLHEKIHNDYKNAGGINEENWLNLYTPLTSMQIDTVSAEDIHPGYKSQSVFFKYLETKFINKLNASKTNYS